jgi:hypothetical protein
MVVKVMGKRIDEYLSIFDFIFIWDVMEANPCLGLVADRLIIVIGVIVIMCRFSIKARNDGYVSIV